MAMDMEDDRFRVHNEVILHLPAAPDTTGYFLSGAAVSVSCSPVAAAAASASSSPTGGASVAGSAVSTYVNSSAPSVSSAGPLLPGEASSPPPPVSSGSGRVLSADADAEADAGPCCSFKASEDVSCSMASDPRRVLTTDISSDAGCDADAGAIVASKGVSASEDACFYALPGDVCSSARRVPTADISSDAGCDADAAGATVASKGVSASEDACFYALPGDVCSSAPGLPGAICSNAAGSSPWPVPCQGKPRVLSEKVVGFIFRHLPVKSIFRLGYLLSRNWFQIWRGIPLVMHDIQLAPDSAIESLNNGDIQSLHLAKNVSRVIDMHPGPVELFRVDSSTWRGGNSLQWRVWIHKLINKNVEEIIVCGRWPKLPMEELPNNLVHCKSLQKMHLCFFSLPRIAENLMLPYLKELYLYYCVFEGSDLDNILRSCALSVLTLGYVKLSVLKIQSQTLQIFGMWRCNIDVLCLSGTPNLMDFSQEPQWTSDHISHLQLRGISNLQVLSEIYLDQQTVELCGYLIKADMVEYPLCLSVTSLALAVNFSYKKDLRWCLPC